MAITASNLTSGSYTAGAHSTFTTASVSPSANRLLLLAVSAAPRDAGRTATPTVSGCGLTWALVREHEYVVAQGGAAYRYINVYRAMGTAPTSGTLTIDFVGEIQQNGNWSVDEFTGAETTGANGSGAIVQSATALGNVVSSLTVTLSAFAHVDNAAYGVFSHTVAEATTPGSGFTELSDVTSAGTAIGHQTEWKATSDNTVDASWSTASRCGGVGIEIKAAFPMTFQNYMSVDVGDGISTGERIR